MIEIGIVALVVVDVQGTLAHAMHDNHLLFKKIQKRIKGNQVLGIPTLGAEQNPDTLGRAIPDMAQLLSDIHPISTLTFDCCGNHNVVGALATNNRNTILPAGIEAHMCVHQTAVGVLDLDYAVDGVRDGTSVQKVADKDIGLQNIRATGGSVTGVETAPFELLVTAEGETFREILRIVK